MKFGELLKHNRPGLVISPRHEEWLKDNGNPKYSPEALRFGTEQMAMQSTPRDRRGTFSASSLNTCRRKQQFTWIGMPEIPPSPKTAGIFQNGTFMHIRWQMAGLTEGWLKEAEVPLPPTNYLGLSGTRDGVAYDGSVVEFKSINTNGFARVNTFGPKEDHLAQVGTYVAAGGHEQGILIYEDKNTQEYREFVIPAEDLPIREIELQAADIEQMTKAEQLFEPLAKCEMKEGYRYMSCPFRDRCLKIREWDDVQDHS